MIKALSLVGLLALASCSKDEEPAPARTTASPTTSPTVVTTASAAETQATAAPSASAARDMGSSPQSATKDKLEAGGENIKRTKYE